MIKGLIAGAIIALIYVFFIEEKEEK